MSEMKIYLSSPPELAAECAGFGDVSVAAYRIGQGFHLYRTALPNTRLSLMDVDCAGFTGFGPHEALILELTRECRYMGYEGICLDLPRPTPQLRSFCEALSRAADSAGLSLYLPEGYAGVSESVRILLPAQNLSGTYGDRLRALAERYGAARLALELERVYTDFPLPSPAGIGSVLSERSFNALNLGQAFYSGLLAVNYASYVSSGRAHLVLWDDVQSLREKLSVARELGVGTAFFYYPHVRDIVGELLT